MAKSVKIFNELRRKIKAHKARVAVIGMGYVGLPLACEFAKKGFNVTGIDTDERRVAEIMRGRSFIRDIPSATIASLVRKRRFSATSATAPLSKADVVIICVPTPLNKLQDPDMSYIIQSVDHIKEHVHPGQLIILESTTYPGTTEELILPSLESRGLKVGRDFFLCFSPERIDPGNTKFHVANIPKVVGGTTPACAALGVSFYGSIIKKVISVTSTKAAEMTKLLENTFRIVNIALINELATIAQSLGVNIWEVIDAASTKPFGFMPFYPGPGVGGHCIGIDPIYLAWKAKHHGEQVRFIELARAVNTQMPRHVVDRIVYLLNEKSGKGIHGSKILVLGAAYKADVSDTRESPAIEIMERLQKLGAKLTYHDPHVSQIKHDPYLWSSVPLRPVTLKSQDLVVYLTNHTRLNRTMIVRHAKHIFDVRNALKAFRKSHIVKL